MKVSVVIPFYNRNETLRISLPSVLAQTRPAHEILVVNDCSKEDIGWLATEFPTVRVLSLPQNRGPGHARYQGARAATGTHVATLDSDDFWYPDKLEKQVAFATEIGDLRGVYTHQQRVDVGDGGTARPIDGPHPGEPIAEYIYVRNNHLQSNTFLLEKELYQELCHVSDEIYADDFELSMRADALRCRIYFQGEVLGHWNCGDNSRRWSKSYKKEPYRRDYLPRQACYFTPKATAAYRGRWLATHLFEQGDFIDAASLMLQAVRQKALSPTAVAKIFAMTAFPRGYALTVRGVNSLRQRKP